MSISRRKFLGWLTAAGFSRSAFGKVAHAATARHFEGHPDSLGVLYDNTKCIGCRTCEAACNKVNDLPPPDLPFDDLLSWTVNEEQMPRNIWSSTSMLAA